MKQPEKNVADIFELLIRKECKSYRKLEKACSILKREIKYKQLRLKHSKILVKKYITF